MSGSQSYRPNLLFRNQPLNGGGAISTLLVACETVRRKRRLVNVNVRSLTVFLAIAPAVVFGQVGRGFTPVESYVALGERVCVGKIAALEPIQYDKPLTSIQSFGHPYRLTFDIEETIRGKPAHRIELVLALQGTRILEFMRDHRSEILLAGGPTMIDDDPGPEMGIEEDGRRVDGYWYQFRFLDAPTKSDSQKDPSLVNQIAISYNEEKMFTIDLNVVQGRESILKRSRAFARKHREMESFVWLPVPNAFGELVGYANAFCGIKLPVCPETERTLLLLLKNSKRIFDRIPRQPDWAKNNLLVDVLKSLKPFPSKANAQLLRKLVGGFDPSFAPVETGIATQQSVQRTAWEVLQAWKM